jgi:hypothetical protein
MKTLPVESDYFKKLTLMMGIIAMFPVNTFYTVTADDYSIKLQGNGSAEAIKIAIKLDFIPIKCSQYLHYQWHIVTLVFTDYDPDGLVLPFDPD